MNLGLYRRIANTDEFLSYRHVQKQTDFLKVNCRIADRFCLIGFVLLDFCRRVALIVADFKREDISEMEWFGKGVKPFDNKYDVLEPYKYHVTIENHIAENHWSDT